MARFVVMTPNPAIDITYTVPRQRLGDTVRVSDARRRPGGKGINVARVLHRLGADVVCVSPLGGSSGRWIVDELEREGLSHRSIDIAGDTRSTLTVADGRSHPTVWAEPGPVLSRREWGDLLVHAQSLLGRDDWLISAGSLPRGVGPADLADLVLVGTDARASVLVDASGPALIAAARAGARIVKCNASEALDATGADTLSLAEAILGGVGADVVISRGADGLSMRAAHSGAAWNQAAVAGVIGNPTGAGDAATAGLALRLAAGADTADALRWAAACGAAAVVSPTAGDIDLTAVSGFLDLL